MYFESEKKLMPEFEVRKKFTSIWNEFNRFWYFLFRITFAVVTNVIIVWINRICFLLHLNHFSIVLLQKKLSFSFYGMYFLIIHINTKISTNIDNEIIWLMNIWQNIILQETRGLESLIKKRYAIICEFVTNSYNKMNVI